MSAPRPVAQLPVFLATYLLDYPLTLAGTFHDGFHEMNPLAASWNHADHLAPLALKLAGALATTLAVLVLQERRPLAVRFLQGATLTFSAVDALSLLQLARTA